MDRAGRFTGNQDPNRGRGWPVVVARIDCFVDLTLSHQNVQPPQTREDEETFLIFEQKSDSFGEVNLIILENQTLPQYK